MKSKIFLLMALAGTAAIGTAAIAIRPNDHTPDPAAKSRVKTTDRVNTASAPAPVLPARTAEEVADRLDALVQPRFLLRGEEFGLARIYIPLNSHQYIRREGNKVIRTPLYSLVGANEEEKELILAADAAHEPYVIGFMHSVVTLGKPAANPPAQQNVTPVALTPTAQFETLAMHTAVSESTPEKDSQVLQAWKSENLKEVNKVLQQCAAAARKGENREAQAGDWLVVLRPVKAADQSCLKCHGRAKVGDTLGVMAYAVHHETNTH